MIGNMDVNIKTKFNVGDKLYTFIPYQDCERKKCDACNGKGIIEIDGNKYQEDE